MSSSEHGADGQDSQRIITINDCQIQTEQSIKSPRSSEISALHHRLAALEQILAAKEENSGEERADKREFGVQVDTQAHDGFSKQEVDEVLIKLKKAHDTIAEKDLMLQKYERIVSELHQKVGWLQEEVELQQQNWEEQKVLDTERSGPAQSHRLALDGLQEQLRESENNNRMLVDKYDQLQREYERYRNGKEFIV